MKEAVANGDVMHVPVSLGAGFGAGVKCDGTVNSVR